ncbi:F-box protein-like protein [Tanacetum coccineum]
MADGDHQSSQSAALIGSYDDLLIEILHRLPVISILRFKSVSKHWRSLLNHRRFTLLYDKSLVSSPGIFARNLYVPFDVENQSSPPFSSLDFYPDPRGIKIVQSCNGLLLCCSNKGNEDRDYYVFNPTTKQFAIIPPVSGGKNVVRNIRCMVLAFHPTDCPHYKVACIYRTTYEQVLNIQIYSSDTRKWKMIPDESFWESYYTPFSGVSYWNGAILWAPASSLPSYFKLDIEKFHDLELPSPLPVRVKPFGCYRDGMRPVYFGESRGHLHLVETASLENPLHLKVFEMFCDHSGWFVKYLVELDDLAATYLEIIRNVQSPSRPYEFEVLDVVKGEEEEDTFMVVKIFMKIIRFNIMDKSFKEIFDLIDTVHGNIGPWDVYRYTKTLTYV